MNDNDNIWLNLTLTEEFSAVAHGNLKDEVLSSLNEALDKYKANIKTLADAMGGLIDETELGLFKDIKPRLMKHIEEKRQGDFRVYVSKESAKLLMNELTQDSLKPIVASVSCDFKL